jgi:hypothetical protein
MRLVRKHANWLWASCNIAVAMALRAAQVEAASTVRLGYVKGAGAGDCPEQMELRMAVSARLGYDPLNLNASKTIVAQVAREGETQPSYRRILRRLASQSTHKPR